MEATTLPIIGHLQEWFGGMLVYGVASSAVRSLPEPSADSSAFYTWFFRFVNAVLANWDKVQSDKLKPQEPPKA